MPGQTDPVGRELSERPVFLWDTEVTSPVVISSTADRASRVSIADIDRDGTPDAVGAFGHKLAWYEDGRVGRGAEGIAHGGLCPGVVPVGWGSRRVSVGIADPGRESRGRDGCTEY